MPKKKIARRGKVSKRFIKEKGLKNVTTQINNLSKKLELLSEKYDSCDGTIVSDVVDHFQDLNSNVKLNVGGAIFYSSRRELRKYPDTRLGKLAEASSISEILKFCDEYKASTDEFCFKKGSNNFSDILEFYRSDSLHISGNHCKTAFNKDLEYWEISSSYLLPCCGIKSEDDKDSLEKNNDSVEEASDPDNQLSLMEQMRDVIRDDFENTDWSVMLHQLVLIFSLMSTFLTFIRIFFNVYL